MLSDELITPQRRGPPLGFWIFLVLVSTLIVSKLLVVGLVEVRGDSMEPEIQAGASCLVTKLGAISVFGQTLFTLRAERDHRVVARPKGRKNYVIKRVAAASGEVLPAGAWQNRWRISKTAAGTRVPKRGVVCTAETCRTKEGHVFLLSARLKGTTDSRHFGAVAAGNLLGRAAVCF
jgi:signal peptidase I